jgi:hypothetical protein
VPGNEARVRPAEELLALPVRVRGIDVGRPVDLIVDRERSRAVGFDVLCGDEAHRFLPFAVAAVRDDEIEIFTPLVLLDFAQVGFYREEAEWVRERHGDLRELAVGGDGTLTRRTRW